MSAVSVTIALDQVERIEIAPHVSTANGQTSVWVDIDYFVSIYGKNPEMFRRLASRCSEAAAILEAANAPVMTAAEVDATCGLLSDESGVA